MKINITKKKKRIIIVVAVLLVAVVGGVSIFGNKGPVLPQVSAGEVQKGKIEQTVSLKGTVQGAENAQVMSSLNYEISGVRVQVGDKVQKGTVLATLDADDLQDQYKKAQIALQGSKFQYDAAQKLYNEGAISKEEYIQKQTAYNGDLANLNSVDMSDKSVIKSPITGTVTRVNATVGKTAADTVTREPLFVIEDIDNLKMSVKISEFDISNIKEGQKVEISAEVLGDKTAEGIVEKIAPTGEKKDETGKEMVVPVTIAVNGQDTGLIAGVSAKAKIIIESKEEAVFVSIDSIFENPKNGKTAVYVIGKDNKIKIIPVKFGIEATLTIEIKEGKVKPGDKVVLNPSFDLTEGMEVLCV